MDPFRYPIEPSLLHDIVQWDVRSWGRVLPWWEKHIDAASVRTALELGGREGGLSLWLALRGAEVTCSDYEDAEQRARPLHLRHGVDHRIQYMNIDACNIPYANHFDVIVFKSIIGGIGAGDNSEKQASVFREAHKALKPGGLLLFAENLVASPLHQFLRKRYNTWGNYWRYPTLKEIKGNLAQFDTYALHTAGVLASLGRSERQRGALNTLDRLGVEAICPSAWHTMVWGAARK